MRTFFSFDTPTPAIPTTMTAKASFSPPPAVTQQGSAWHSPVPYLFGGLAAMLGLITFALMILACSYWKLSGRVENRAGDDGNGEGDLERGGGEKDSDGGESSKAAKVYEEKILVIMAGDEKPTFLATPVVCSSSKVSCFGDGLEMVKNREGDRFENGDHKVKEVDVHEENSENHDTETDTRQDQEHNQ
ncbi:hypothetical protein JRO89_XS03G0237600 [Xanthoceras sorbifolium]|uniref:Uncharacterized protein n=1 Tax=Xanthoceras sorbifolium TaxID=99658 RepID=A0ABQ8IBJ3_9ROSI|nr:hypothetical protein JRO89_XS03G0237600 [Xanthoceras sorbifolium]